MGLLACAVVFLLLTAPAFGGAEARISAMRAGNEMPTDVGVYSQVPGYFGAQRWQRVVTRTAKSSVDLPDVPAGAVPGVDTAGG